MRITVDFSIWNICASNFHEEVSFVALDFGVGVDPSQGIWSQNRVNLFHPESCKRTVLTRHQFVDQLKVSQRDLWIMSTSVKLAVESRCVSFCVAYKTAFCSFVSLL